MPQASAEPLSGRSYTQAELAALDRALEAANLDRKSLTFRKALTDAGHIIVPGGIVDQHVKGRDGKVPKSLAPYLAACGDDKLPRICISSKTVEEVPRSFYIPVDADDESILELLKGVK